MKKRIHIALLLCILLAVSVSAHPGRTDSSGGHTVSETGEYHYHHGYSAHDHEDLDGDGDLDCPYDFDDKTGISSGHSSGSSGESSYSRTDGANEKAQDDFTGWNPSTPAVESTSGISETKPITISSTDSVVYAKNPTPQNNPSSFDYGWLAAIMCLIGTFSVVGAVRLERRIQTEARQQENFEALCAGLDTMPPNTYIDKSGDLHCFIDHDDIFAFYHNNGNVVHRRNCRYASSHSPINISKLSFHFVPCRNCCPDIPQISWIHLYNDIGERPDFIEKMAKAEAMQRKENSEYITQCTIKLREEAELIKNRYVSLETTLEQLEGKYHGISLSDFPEDVYDVLVRHKPLVSEHDAIFCISHSKKIYHNDRCHHADLSRRICAFHIRKKFPSARPCRFCFPVLPLRTIPQQELEFYSNVLQYKQLVQTFTKQTTITPVLPAAPSHNEPDRPAAAASDL